MFALLHQYLINCSHVVLPGIGTLQFADAPAQTMSNGYILSPKQTIVLVNNNLQGNDPKLISFIGKQLDMSDNQADSLFILFLQSIKAKIAEHKTVLWENLGTFKKGKDGKIRFIQDEAIENYLPRIDESLISNHNVSQYDLLVVENETNDIDVKGESESTKSKKSYWWIWAIIIAIISGGIIAFKFLGY